MKRAILSLFTALSLAAAAGIASPAHAADAEPVMPALLFNAKPAGVKGAMSLPGKRTASTNASALACPCYSYAGGRQYVTYDGAGVNLTVHKPPMQVGDHYTSATLAVESVDARQVVQVGWTVNPSLFGNAEPHIFVFRWVNGIPGCYNGCGWVPAAGAAVHAGDSLTVAIGASRQFAIQYISGNWWVGFNGQWFGAFLGTQWSGATPPATFTQGTRLEAYGEVAANVAGSCTDMGNGTIASYPTPDAGAKINGYALAGGSAPANFATYFATSPAQWGVVAAGTLGIGLRYGGPGFC